LPRFQEQVKLQDERLLEAMDLPAMLLVTSSHIQTVYICTDTTIFAAEREPPIDFA